MSTSTTDAKAQLAELINAYLKLAEISGSIDALEKASMRLGLYALYRDREMLLDRYGVLSCKVDALAGKLEKELAEFWPEAEANEREAEIERDKARAEWESLQASLSAEACSEIRDSAESRYSQAKAKFLAAHLLALRARRAARLLAARAR